MPDPMRVRRWAVASLAADVSVLLNMLGFLVFPNSIVAVAAAMLPMWIVSLALILRIPRVAARPRR